MVDETVREEDERENPDESAPDEPSKDLDELEDPEEAEEPEETPGPDSEGRTPPPDNLQNDPAYEPQGPLKGVKGG